MASLFLARYYMCFLSDLNRSIAEYVINSTEFPEILICMSCPYPLSRDLFSNALGGDFQG